MSWIRIMVGCVLGIGLMVASPGAAFASFPDEPSAVIELEQAAFLPYCVEVGDLNDDGRPDLLVGVWYRSPETKGYESEKSQVLLYCQTETGEFNASPDRAIRLSGKSHPAGMLVGDFDEDGKNDLAVAEARYYFHLFLGSDELEVGHEDYNVNHRRHGRADMPVAGSMREGETDFLVGPAIRRWVEGDQFNRGYFYHASGQHDNGGVALADLDNNGVDDAIFTSRSGEIRLYYGPVTNIRKIYPQDVQFVRLSSSLPLSWVKVADLNGDDRPDIVASGSDDEKHRVLIYNQGSPTGFAEGADPSIAIEGISGPLALTDVTGNGLSDLIVADESEPRGSKKIYIFEQKRDASFAERHEDADAVVDVGDFYAVSIDDVTGNGQDDLITTVYRGNRPSEVRIYFNSSEKNN